MSLLPYIKADLFLTGDIKYHEAMEAKALGISLIDIGHFESEIFFSEILYKLLENYLKKNMALSNSLSRASIFIRTSDSRKHYPYFVGVLN